MTITRAKPASVAPWPRRPAPSLAQEGRLGLVACGQQMPSQRQQFTYLWYVGILGQHFQNGKSGPGWSMYAPLRLSVDSSSIFRFKATSKSFCWMP